MDRRDAEESMSRSPRPRIPTGVPGLDTSGLTDDSARGVRRTWRAQRFSWWMSTMLHRDDRDTPFDERRRIADLEYLVTSRAAMTSLAENYVGLPLD